METKPYSKITILDICKRADLSRQTFYNCFDSKEEILHIYLRQQCESQFHKYKEKTSITTEDIVNAFSDVLIANKQLLSSMLKNNLDSIIADEVSESVALFADHFVNKSSPREILPYSKVLLSGALAQLIVFWFKQEKPISVEKITGLLTDFFRGKLYGLN